MTRRRASAEHAPANMPLGATLHEGGVVFSVWSAHATQITLSTFEGDGSETTYAMRPLDDGTHALFVRGAGEGLRYGYRAHGPWAPEAGMRFNPKKLLLDPYARRIVGAYDPRGPIVDHVPGDRHRACSEDSAPYVPRSVVRAPLAALPLSQIGALHPLSRTVVYEAHVARLTELCTEVPRAHRGRLAALRSPTVIAHLRRLGVTTLELMPVQAWMSEPRLLTMGLANHWGYSPVGFLALEESYATLGDDPRVALRETCLALRAAGIDVWIDVVFNHTAELDLDGPVFHLRGLDSKSYYRQQDSTGCGNSVRAEHPRVVELFCAALRELVLGCGIAGFRFDLGAALGRQDGVPLAESMQSAPFFAALDRDPVLSRVQRVVEPWDAKGYALGAFAAPTLEWNDRYRDDVRRFFRGEAKARGDFATRVAGSSDVFARARGPGASLNMITCHDGFTLADLVSFDRKHNEANGEANRDGHEPNYAESFGVEGPSDDPRVVAQRLAKQKALFLTLLLSAGVPMLHMGDEFGRTQHGNNNAYCHAFPVRWPEGARAPDLLLFVQRLVALRAEVPELQRSAFFEAHELSWCERDGRAANWSEPQVTLAAWLRSEGGDLWLLWNGGSEPAAFVPPRPATQVLVQLRSDEHLAAPDEDPKEQLLLFGRSAAAIRFAAAK